MKKIIKVATRDSKLAMAQTGIVIEKLRSIAPDYDYECVAIKTKGDKILDKSLNKIGGKGLFIKELQDALRLGRVDFAVHSLKDMPISNSDDEADTYIAAITSRGDARDVLVSKKNKAFEPHSGAVIGTGSLRRALQLKKLMPDIIIKPIRGNILTRLNKLDYEDFDAIVLAAAGLQRVGLEDRISKYLDPESFVPAVGQGALAIEVGRSCKYLDLLMTVNCAESQFLTSLERQYLKALDGNCSTPLGSHASFHDGLVHFIGMFGEEKSGKVVTGRFVCNKNEAMAKVHQLAIDLKERCING